MALEPARSLVIANPAARGGAVGRGWEALAARVTAALGPVRFARTERPGHAAALAERAAREGLGAVLSLGGDGTHHEVVQGLMRAGAHGTALGVIPAGTGGDLRRSLPAASLDAALAALPTAASRAIDVGHAAFVTDDGAATERWFINLASCGLSGHIDRRVNASAKRFGAASFALATARALVGFAPPRVRVFADGELWCERSVDLVLAGNGRYAGGGMRLAPEAALDDGWLDAAVVAHASPLRSLRDGPRLYDGTLADSPRVLTRRVRALRVEVLAGVAPIDLDGESPGRAPLTWRVLPGALRLLG